MTVIYFFLLRGTITKLILLYVLKMYTPNHARVHSLLFLINVKFTNKYFFNRSIDIANGKILWYNYLVLLYIYLNYVAYQLKAKNYSERKR